MSSQETLDGPRQQYKRLEHSTLAQIVSQMVEKLSVDHLLAYGGLTEDFWMGFSPQRNVGIQAYRPQIEGKHSMALPSQLVVCVDYLEHTGVLGVEDALNDLQRVTLGSIFVHIKVMEFPDDVQGARAVDRPAIWWLREFAKRFDIQTYQRLPGGLYIIAYPLPKQEIIH